MGIEGFTTDRLIIRHWRPVIANVHDRKDLMDELARILTAPVLAPLPPSLQLDHGPKHLSSWIDARAAESEVFLVRMKEPEGLAGLLILAEDPEALNLPTVHIGYLLGEEVWGMGLASELVAGLVAEVARHGPARLRGGVDRDNPASTRVLKKSGFARVDALSTKESDVYERRV